MAKINIVVADGNFLVRKGISSIVAANKDLQLVAEAKDTDELREKLTLFPEALLIIDFLSVLPRGNDLKELSSRYPMVKILAITDIQPKVLMAKSFEMGLTSYLLKECDEEEILQAIYSTAKGERFLCGKIVDVMADNNKDFENAPSFVACDGVGVTDRELEIIQLVAEGYANKQIADKLFLSTHTVTTHRKNIMNKLGIANTAGLVLYAVKENLISPNKYLFSSSN